MDVSKKITNMKYETRINEKGVKQRRKGGKVGEGWAKCCQKDECISFAMVGGLCSKHGGGRRCKENNCSFGVTHGGFCSTHGPRCLEEGCLSAGCRNGLCKKHGGPRCSIVGCNTSAQNARIMCKTWRRSPL